MGATGQSNYAAGNAFQDELAKFRFSLGEKAISLDLSTLVDDGWASENKDWLKQYYNTKQLMLMYRSEVYAMLDHYCNKAIPVNRKRSQVVMGLEVPADVASRGIEMADWMGDPMFANLHQLSSSLSAQRQVINGVLGEGSPDLVSLVAEATSLTEAAEAITSSFIVKLSRIISMSPDDLDVNLPLHTYGVDSLIGVELRNWFKKTAKQDVAVFQLLGGASAAELGQEVAEKMGSWN